MKVEQIEQTLVFELEDYEWYGPGQAAFRDEMRRRGWEARVDHVVAFVTPDALFPVSPVQGRHRAYHEALTPVLDKIECECSILIGADAYEAAPVEFRAHMIERAKHTLITEIGKLNQKRTRTRYTIRTELEVLDTGMFEHES